MVHMTKVTIKTGITTVQALGGNPNKAPAMTIALESCSRWPTRNEPTSTKAAPPQSVGNQKKSGRGSSKRKISSAKPCRKSHRRRRPRGHDRTNCETGRAPV
jgi:hypothetical protein